MSQWVILLQGDRCWFYTDGGSYVSHPANSVISVTGSQLDGGNGNCEGWIGGSSSPTEDGWRIYILYRSYSHYDNLILSDGHVYFTTDIANGIGLFCNINHEFDYLGDNEEIFSCHWS